MYKAVQSAVQRGSATVSGTGVGRRHLSVVGRGMWGGFVRNRRWKGRAEPPRLSPWPSSCATTSTPLSLPTLSTLSTLFTPPRYLQRYLIPPRCLIPQRCRRSLRIPPLNCRRSHRGNMRSQKHLRILLQRHHYYPTHLQLTASTSSHPHAGYSRREIMSSSLPHIPTLSSHLSSLPSPTASATHPPRPSTPHLFIPP